MKVSQSEVFQSEVFQSEVFQSEVSQSEAFQADPSWRRARSAAACRRCRAEHGGVGKIAPVPSASAQTGLSRYGRDLNDQLTKCVAEIGMISSARMPKPVTSSGSIWAASAVKRTMIFLPTAAKVYSLDQ